MRLTNAEGQDARTASLELSAWRVKDKGQKDATLVCPPWGTGLEYPLDHTSPETGKTVKAAPCVGILDVQTNYAIGQLPFKVDLSSEGIIGPSAGLAFTLGLMQTLDAEDLTGGHLAAATGTMSINGQIGAIGGVWQKTIAVYNAGARIFFVPKANYAEAEAHDPDHAVKIYPVTNISEVIARLEKTYGGRLAK